MKKLMTLFILFVSVQSSFAQKMRGQVLDQESKLPLWGASVSCVGSPNGTITDANGYFSIRLLSQKNILKISFVGYEPVEILAEKANPFLISKNLAEIKSIKVSNKNPDRLVLGADSVISLNDELIN